MINRKFLSFIVDKKYLSIYFLSAIIDWMKGERCMKKIYWLYLGLLSVPILINYLLLTWHMPGVKTEANPWLAFLGSYFGVLGAITIAVYNNKIQKDKDRKNEKVQKDKDRSNELKRYRSFVVMTEFTAHADLKNIKTHENSRIIETEAYQDLVLFNDSTKAVTSFLKLSQYGNSPIIMDCKLEIRLTNKRTKKEHILNMNIGPIEKDIEVYCPIIPEDTEFGDEVNISYIEISYVTLVNEKMKYVIDHTISKEYYSFINDKLQETELFSQAITSSKWSYPNKKKEKDKS
jgi:hypothetical protein